MNIYRFVRDWDSSSKYYSYKELIKISLVKKRYIKVHAVLYYNTNKLVLQLFPIVPV